MIKMLSRSFFCIVAALLMFVACTQTTSTSPYDCSNTKGGVFVKSFNKSALSTIAITDTIGDSIYCGFNTNLPMNVDSVEIRKGSLSDPVGNLVFTLKNIHSLKFSDTVWQSLFLTDTGTITIMGTAYLNCKKTLSATVAVTIRSRQPNNPPKLLVPRQINLHPGDACTLAVAASDIDTFQTLKFSALKAPIGSSFNSQSHIFIWQAPVNFIGVDSAVFKVKDNGYPSLADSQTVYLNVKATFVNNSPVLIVIGIRNINPGDTCTLKLKATDPDSLQTVKDSMLWGPKGSVLKDSIFTWAAPWTFKGMDSAKFMAKDDGLPPISDTVTVYITVSNNIPLPSKPDSLKIVSRVSGWVILQWRASAVTDFYTVFRSSITQGAAFKVIDTVYDTLFKDSIGSLNCRYYVKAYNTSGQSPSSDTVTTLYSNQPPKWQQDTINLVDTIGQTVTLTLSTLCSDPNGDPITYSLMAGKPEGDTIISGVYSFTPAASDVGVFWPLIVAKDPQGLANILTIHLTILSPNHKPALTITGTRNVKSGTTCTLTATATDPDSNQTLTYSMIKKPAGSTFNASTGAFTWATPATFKGTDTAIFTAADNGAPPLSDTVIVQIFVSDTIINHPPKWQSDTISQSATVGNALNLTLATMCSDPDGDKLYFTLIAGKPDADTIKNGTYSFTPKASDSGVFWPHIIVKDSAGLADTLTLRLTVTGATDRIPPYLKLFSPASDSATIGTSSITVKIVCKDSSGVASVKCSTGTDTFAVSHADSIYSAVVTGLKSTGMNEILFIATDASANANRDTLKVHIKYDSDATGPIITIVTPAKDSVSTNSSSFMVTLQCTDASGVLSVNGAMGSSTFTGVRASGNNWTIAVSGLVINVFNTIVFTATDSSLRANKTLDTLHIKYDPTMIDVDGPVFLQLSGPVSGTVVSDSLVSIVDSVSDGSGVDSVYYLTLNGKNQRNLTVTTSSALGGRYSLKDTLRREKIDTIVVTAVDKSANRNRSTQTIILNYIIAPKITKQPVSDTVCSGSQAIFSVTATGTAPLSYQWRTGATSFTTIGTNSPLCTLKNVTATTLLSCVVSNGASTNMTSNLCTLTVNPGVTINQNPVATSTCPGINAMLNVVAAGGTGLHYQWYIGPLGNSTAVSGATSASLSTSTAGTYFCVVTNSTGCMATSPEAVLTVNAAPTISDPSPTSTCTGGSGATMTVSPSAGATAQWFKGSPSGTHTSLSNNTYYSGVTTSTLTFNNATASIDDSYYCVATLGACQATSATAHLTVNAAPTISDPSPTSTCTGGSGATMTVSPSAGATAQWFKGSPSGTHTSLSNNTYYSGVTTSTLTFNNATASIDDSYYCVATLGTCQATSATAHLTVNVPPSVTDPVPASASICAGKSTSFSVTPSSGAGLSWQWLKGASPISEAGYSGQNTSNLMIGAPATNTPGTYSFRCVVSSAGCPDTSHAAQLTVNPSLNISTHPQDAILCYNMPAGGTSIFVAVSGGSGTLHYKWQRNNQPLNGTESYIYGANTNPRLYFSWDANATAQYRCNVYDDDGCSVYSNNANVTANPEIWIESQPQLQKPVADICASCDGSNRVSVTAHGGTGDATLSHLWYKDGLPFSSSIPGYNQPMVLLCPSNWSSPSGNYYCVITDNNNCSVVSDSLKINCP